MSSVNGKSDFSSASTYSSTETEITEKPESNEEEDEEVTSPVQVVKPPLNVRFVERKSRIVPGAHVKSSVILHAACSMGEHNVDMERLIHIYRDSVHSRGTSITDTSFLAINADRGLSTDAVIVSIFTKEPEIARQLCAGFHDQRQVENVIEFFSEKKKDNIRYSDGFKFEEPLF